MHALRSDRACQFANNADSSQSILSDLNGRSSRRRPQRLDPYRPVGLGDSGQSLLSGPATKELWQAPGCVSADERPVASDLPRAAYRVERPRLRGSPPRWIQSGSSEARHSSDLSVSDRPANTRTATSLKRWAAGVSPPLT
jgi:hypothetical protein